MQILICSLWEKYIHFLTRSENANLAFKESNEYELE